MVEACKCARILRYENEEPVEWDNDFGKCDVCPVMSDCDGYKVTWEDYTDYPNKI